MIPIRIENDFLFSTLLNQIYNTNWLVQLQLRVEVLCKSDLCFVVIWLKEKKI